MREKLPNASKTTCIRGEFLCVKISWPGVQKLSCTFTGLVSLYA